MRHALADKLAAAVADHLFNQLEVRPVGEGRAWRVVTGEVRRGAQVQQWDGLASKMVTGSDEVHLLASDFPDGLPTTSWWVRELDGPNVGRVMRLAEPARVSGHSGRFVVAPLKANSESVPA